MLCSVSQDHLRFVLHEAYGFFHPFSNHQVHRLDELLAQSSSSAEEMQREHTERVLDLEMTLTSSMEKAMNEAKIEQQRLEEHYTNIISQHQSRQNVSRFL